MIHNSSSDYNRGPPLSASLIDALGAELAAFGITASAAALLRHLHRQSLVSRPLPPSSAVGRGDGIG